MSAEIGKWLQGKPDYACVFATRQKFSNRFEYDLHSFEWERAEENDENVLYYLAWIDQDGEEFGDIDDMAVNEYLVLEILPKMEETHAEWTKSLQSAV